MFEFEWIKKFLKKPVVDPWYGCNRAFYVFAFREQLDKIAEALSFQDGRAAVYSRFDRQRKCAELYTRSGDILARIYGRGEMGCTTHAIVASNLPKGSLEIFVKYIPYRVQFENL